MSFTCELNLVLGHTCFVFRGASSSAVQPQTIASVHLIGTPGQTRVERNCFYLNLQCKRGGGIVGGAVDGCECHHCLRWQGRPGYLFYSKVANRRSYRRS
jgi:hypothetical protein